MVILLGFALLVIVAVLWVNKSASTVRFKQLATDSLIKQLFVLSLGIVSCYSVLNHGFFHLIWIAPLLLFLLLFDYLSVASSLSRPLTDTLKYLMVINNPGSKEAKTNQHLHKLDRGGDVGCLQRSLTEHSKDLELTSYLNTGQLNESCSEENLLKLDQLLRAFINEVDYVKFELLAGRSAKLSENRTKNGVWAKLSESINEIIELYQNPLEDIQKAIKALADGDLTLRLSEDSQGVTGQNFNRALDNVDGLLSQVNEHSNSIEVASSEMHTSGKEMSTSTDEIANSISEMSHGAQRQVSEIDKSSTLIEQLVNGSKEMGQMAEEIHGSAVKGVTHSNTGKDIIGRLDECMVDIAEYSDKTNKSVDQLTSRSREIERVLIVIKEIASQTNLLALNAAIEAAQAGDAGRGFSVVAEEVRKLAEISSKSVKEIQELVNGVQQETREVSKVMQEMNQRVMIGNETSQEASKVFQDIHESANSTLSRSEHIVEETKGQIVSLRDVACNIESIVVIAEETAAGSEQIATSATELASGMQEYLRRSEELDHIANSLKDGLSMVKLSSSASDNAAIFKMREAFEHEKMLLDALLDYMPDSIFFKDLESRYIRYSESHAVRVGVSRQELLGKLDTEVSSEFGQMALEEERRIISTGESVMNREERVHTSNGEVYLSTTKLPLRDLNGKIIGTYGISRDITQSKLLEQRAFEAKQIQIRATLETVQKQNALFGDILNFIDNKVALKAPDGKIYLINESVARDYGIPAKDILGKSDFDFFDKVTAEKIHKVEKELVANRKPVISLEKVTLTETKYWFIRKIPIFIPEFDDWGLLVIQNEIEEQKVKENGYVSELRTKYPALVLDI